MSSRVTGKPPTRWRRPVTRTYDYNYTLGENYYKPQLDYIDSRKGRGNTPPSATTYVERLLRYPTSGRSSSATRRAEESRAELGRSSAASAHAEDSLDRYTSLEDLGLDEDLVRRRRKLLSLTSQSQENLADIRSPLSPEIRGNRVTFGDKMLDAVGVKEGSIGRQQSSSSSLTSSSRLQKKTFASSTSSRAAAEEDALDQILAERKNRRQFAGVQSADPDLYTEDPMASPRVSLSSRLQTARQQMDEMRDEMKKDADASSSRFRSRIRARRASREEQLGSSETSAATAVSSSGLKMTSSSMSSSAQKLSASAQSLIDDDDAETAAILSKVEQIRKRAKARLAAINDEFDFPDLQIESSLASRRANKTRQALDDDFDSQEFGSTSRLASSSGRSAAMSKRTVRASYEIE